MFYQLDDEQIDSLKATLEKIKVLKTLTEYGYKFGRTYIESDNDDGYADIEEFVSSVLTILNETSTCGDFLCEEEAKDLGVDLLYGEDEVATTIVRMQQPDVVKYLDYHKSIGTPVGDLVHFAETAENLIYCTNNYWNDYEYKGSFIGLDYNVYLICTDMDFMNESFVENFMDMVYYCKKANAQIQEKQRKIEESKAQHKRLPRGKKRRERMRIERERLLIAA